MKKPSIAAGLFFLDLQGNSGRGERIRTSGLYVPKNAYGAGFCLSKGAKGNNRCSTTVSTTLLHVGKNKGFAAGDASFSGASLPISPPTH
jgi:hypothetical protein